MIISERWTATGKKQKRQLFSNGHYRSRKPYPHKTLLDRGSDFPIDPKDPKIQKELSQDDEYGMITTLERLF